MNITPNQLKAKPKKIGELDGAPVMQAETKGGLFLIMTKAGGQPKTLGAGSHPAVARHIAERDFPELKLTELMKNESLEPQVLRTETQRCLPITRRLQALEK
jgi:hypothetical protein